MPDFIKDIFEETLRLLLDEYGGLFVFLLIIIVYLFVKYERAHANIVKQKDAEIERLIEERNWYQGHVLSDRLSTKPQGGGADTTGEEESEQ